MSVTRSLVRVFICFLLPGSPFLYLFTDIWFCGFTSCLVLAFSEHQTWRQHPLNMSFVNVTGTDVTSAKAGQSLYGHVETSPLSLPESHCVVGWIWLWGNRRRPVTHMRSVYEHLKSVSYWLRDFGQSCPPSSLSSGGWIVWWPPDSSLED